MRKFAGVKLSITKKILLSSIMLTVFGTSLWAQGGSADNCSTVGTNCSCNHSKVEIRMATDGSVHTDDYTGFMSIDCIDNGLAADGHRWWKHRSRGFEVTAQSATLGNVRVYLDESRTQPDGYLTSLTAATHFPASHHVYAYARATMTSKPGTVYRSTAPFHMYNNSVNSFGVEGANIQYTVESDINFEDEANPGTIVFTVKATPTTVNP